MFVKRQHPKGCATLQAHLLPGDEIAVVLKLRDDNFITRLHKLLTEGIRQQIDRLGCAAGEDHLVVVFRVDVPCHFSPGAFVGFGSLYRQGVVAAMDVGIEARVIINQ